MLLKASASRQLRPVLLITVDFVGLTVNTAFIKKALHVQAIYEKEASCGMMKTGNME